MRISVLTSYCNFLRDPDNAVFHRMLDGLEAQTVRPEVIVCDDSHPDDQAAVKRLCKEHGAAYMGFPFTNYAFAYARKYNVGLCLATGDLIVILCSSWWLAPNWIEEQAKWLLELGTGNLVGTDNDRRNLPLNEGEPAQDWFWGCPEKFQVCMPEYFDNARFMFYKCEAIPFDEEFDPPLGYMGGDRGSMHATVYWVWQQMRRGMKLWLRRDLEMEHGVMPRGFQIVEQVTKQVRWSEKVAYQKGYPR